MSKMLRLKVNGTAMTASVPARTQLAEVLRDYLDLTGTHLGCEQGVCGACTVMMDGAPIRSCITFAEDCDGKNIDTIEGSPDDDISQILKEAFSKHHALQCGFCTPGMLSTAKDIITRFGKIDEKLVRHELSGNLCRCTGYQGIVSAILDAKEQLDAGVELEGIPESKVLQPKFTPFVPKFDEANAGNSTEKGIGSIYQDEDWTVVKRSLTLSYPSNDVWQLFSDVATVATCVPGANIDEISRESFEGNIEVAFGPIKAKFGGTGTFKNNAEDQTGFILGTGADKNGQSNVNGELRYKIDSEGESSSCVSVEFRFQIQGVLAQFNRPELVTGFVDFLLDRFVANCNSLLSGGEVTSGHKIGFFALAFAVLKSLVLRRGRSNE